MNYARTAILLAGLTGLFTAVGYLIGAAAGPDRAQIIVVVAGTNLFSYWNSDKLVLSMHDTQEVDERSAPIAQAAGLIFKLAVPRHQQRARILPLRRLRQPRA